MAFITTPHETDIAPGAATPLAASPALDGLEQTCNEPANTLQAHNQRQNAGKPFGEQRELASSTQARELRRRTVRTHVEEQLRQAASLELTEEAIEELNEQDPRGRLLLQQGYILHNYGVALLREATHGKFSGWQEQQGVFKRGTDMLRQSRECMIAHDKLRRGGEQRVTVQHVHVSEGGQAVVAANVGRKEAL